MCNISMASSSSTTSSNGSSNGVSNEVIVHTYKLKSFEGFDASPNGGVSFKSGSSQDSLCIREDDGYTVLKYNKQCLNAGNVNSLGLFRSVIYYDNELVSFSPPKSYNEGSYLSPDELNSTDFSVEHFIEGTMMNVFYNKANSQWEVATRSIIGGETAFYVNTKTFKQMFEEAAHYCNLSLDDLNPTYVYSFVMHHPENRIVEKITAPRLFLTNVYRIHKETHEVHEINVMQTHAVNKLFMGTSVVVDVRDQEFLQTGIKLKHCIMMLKAKYTSYNTPYFVQGVVIKFNGKRLKIRNPNHNFVSNLKGNQSKLQYQFYVLKKQGKLNLYLSYFPEHKPLFDQYEHQLNNFITNVHHAYMNTYILKTPNKCSNLSKEIQRQLNPLHSLYMSFLRYHRLAVTWEVVSKHIHELEPAQIMSNVNNVSM